MTKLHRIDAVSSLVGGGCVMDGDTIIAWHNEKPQPSEAEIDAEFARLQARQVILDKIEAFEAEITPRRIRDSVLTADGKTWLTNKEAEIATERDKL